MIQNHILCDPNRFRIGRNIAENIPYEKVKRKIKFFLFLYIVERW